MPSLLYAAMLYAYIKHMENTYVTHSSYQHSIKTFYIPYQMEMGGTLFCIHARIVLSKVLP